jgi:hypothetical protein
MLDNDYLNLYQSDFYKKEVNFFNSNNDTEGLENFEQSFSLANTLYTESKKCIGFTDTDPKYAAMTVSGNNDIITTILSSDQSIFEILRDAEGIERTVKPSKNMTSLEAAIKVCEKHLEKIKQDSTGMHR